MLERDFPVFCRDNSTRRPSKGCIWYVSRNTTTFFTCNSGWYFNHRFTKAAAFGRDARRGFMACCASHRQR